MELKVVAIPVVVDIRILNMGKWVQIIVGYLVVILVFSKVWTAKVQAVAQQALERILLQMELQVVATLVAVDIRILNIGKWLQVLVGYKIIILVFRKV